MNKSEKRYSALLFDWSGTISDDNGDQIIHNSLIEIGATHNQIEVIIKTLFKDFMLGNISEIEYWSKIREQYNLNIPTNYHGAFNNWVGVSPNSEMVDFIKNIKARGYKVGLLTNIIKPVFDIIKKSGYYDIFDVMVASCEVNLAKPEPEIFKLTINKLKVDPENTIFIDDKESNLETAKKLGLKTVLAQKTPQTIFGIKSLLES